MGTARGLMRLFMGTDLLVGLFQRADLLLDLGCLGAVPEEAEDDDDDPVESGAGPPPDCPSGPDSPAAAVRAVRAGNALNTAADEVTAGRPTVESPAV